jgi:hypothetical protein
VEPTQTQIHRPRHLDPGPPKAVYVVRQERLRQRTFLIIASLVGALASSGFAIYRWNFAYTRFGPAVIGRWTRPYLTAAIILVAFAALQGFLRRRERRHQVSTHVRGLLLRDGKRVLFIPWGSIDGLRIAAVRYGLPGWIWGDQSQLTLDTNDGDHHRLTGALTDLHALIRDIKTQVFPRLLQEYRRDFEHRKPLKFGPISLLPDGLQIRRHTIPWENVRGAVIAGGRFEVSRITARGEARKSLPVRIVPNADLCKQLIESIEIRP